MTFSDNYLDGYRAEHKQLLALTKAPKTQRRYADRARIALKGGAGIEHTADCRGSRNTPRHK